MGSLSMAAVLLLFIIQEVLVCQSAPLNQFSAAHGHGSNREAKWLRIRRQDIAREWIVSEWSACTVSCGSGFRTRSVRCLDEDGVISLDCDINLRDASYEFCGQEDCISGAATPNVLPPDGEYEISGSDGTSTVLTFDNIGGTSFIQQETTEVDMTTTNFFGTENPTEVLTISYRPQPNDITFPQEDGIVSLLVDNNTIVSLNDLQVIPIDNSTEVSYSDRTISLNGFPFISDVDTFYYHDPFRFYPFEGDKINSVPGPGTIYYDPVMGSALYSNNLDFNSNFDMVLMELLSPEITDSPPTDVPSTSVVTDAPTPSVDPATDDPTPSVDPATDAPTPSVDPATDGPTPSVDPATDGPTPSVDPVTDGPTPSVDPATDDPTPSVDPATDGPTPSVDPATDGPTPSVDPVTDGPTPSVDPVTDCPTPSVDPATDGQTTVSPHKPRTTIARTDAKPMDVDPTDPDPMTAVDTEEPSTSSPDPDEEPTDSDPDEEPTDSDREEESTERSVTSGKKSRKTKKSDRRTKVSPKKKSRKSSKVSRKEKSPRSRQENEESSNESSVTKSSGKTRKSKKQKGKKHNHKSVRYVSESEERKSSEESSSIA